MGKKLLNLCLTAAVFSLTLWSVFHGENLTRLLQQLTGANPGYVWAGVACVLLFILGESLVIHCLLRSLGQRHRASHCCLYSFIGFFYSCITPSASGGQPMQVMAMRKDRIPVAVSTVVLAIVTVAYKLVLVLIGLAVLLFRPARVMACLEPALPLMYLGLALNVVFIAGLLLLIFHPSFVRRGAAWLFRWLHRIRPFRHPEKQSQRLERLVTQYEGAAAYYGSHRRVILQVFLITLAQRGVLFLVTWLSYRAFGLAGERMGDLVLLQAMIAVASDMLPLPGGMGVSENLFLTIFLPVFGAAFVLPGMVVSRGISYYTQLLVSAAMTGVASFVIKET